MKIRILNHTKHIKHVGNVSLNIGGNEVNEKDWDVVSKHPIVKIWLENGDVEVEKGDLEDITKIVPANKAVLVIETTFSQGKLQKWLETETRKTVIDAIEKQIEYLEKEKEDA